jgi:hypothetical protein
MTFHAGDNISFYNCWHSDYGSWLLKLAAHKLIWRRHIHDGTATKQFSWLHRMAQPYALGVSPVFLNTPIPITESADIIYH